MEKLKIILNRLVGIAFILVIWQVVSSFNLLEPTLFPSPSRTFSALTNLFLYNNLLREIVHTLQRVFSAFLVASTFGVFLGLLIGVNGFLYKSFESVIDFFRSIPVVTLYPVFILLFGINDEAKIAMTFWATIWIVTLNTIYGVKQSVATRRDVAKVYGASKSQSFRWITFFEALPQTLVGMRIAVSYALLVQIMCEMFMGSNFGIGQRLFEFNVRFSMPELFALVAVTGSLGIIINRLFIMLERKIVPWVGKS